MQSEERNFTGSGDALPRRSPKQKNIYIKCWLQRKLVLIDHFVSCREYHDFRAALMISNNEGLTKTYNRFHRPDEYYQDILELRRLHDAMDRAVLDAYGWTDLQPVPEFFTEFEAAEETEDDAPSS